MSRRVETRTSRTAELTCLTRAVSYHEEIPQFHCADNIAPLLAPGFLRPLLKSRRLRRFYRNGFAPKGMFEYVVARTKYLDGVFATAIEQGFSQILIFGAGFNSRAIRFSRGLSPVTVYELDAGPTQAAKIGQLAKRGIAIPENVVFVSIDFARETLRDKLESAGFLAGQRTLFFMEGLLMYLNEPAVEGTFRSVGDLAGPGSEIVFDVVYSSVIRGEDRFYGSTDLRKSVERAGEPWTFGLEKGDLAAFLDRHRLTELECMDADELERRFFTDASGQSVGRVNGTHFIVRAMING